MMTEISLNVLDVVQNSICAKADMIGVSVAVDSIRDTLEIIISDNGCGMTEEQVKKVVDPFYTTRTTRAVGLGIPFFKYAAESTGGSFTLCSEPGKGTVVTAVFVLSHLDRMPLGDMTGTMHMLITGNNAIDFLYSYAVDGKSFTLDTREFREILGDVPFDMFEVSCYIKEYLQENKDYVDEGRYI